MSSGISRKDSNTKELSSAGAASTDSPLINVNVVNEEHNQPQSAIAKVASSTMSVSATTTSSHSRLHNLITSNLSLNTGSKAFGAHKSAAASSGASGGGNSGGNSGHHSHGSGLFSSLKATTLNASKIFNKAASLSRSASPQTAVANAAAIAAHHHHHHHHHHKKPIDLEAHIITDDTAVKSSGSKSPGIKAYLSGNDSSSSEEGSSSSCEDEDEEEEEDEEDEDEEEGSESEHERTATTPPATTSVAQRTKKLLSRKHSGPKTHQTQSSDSNKHVSTHNRSLTTPKSKKKKKGFLSVSLFEDEDEDEENLDSMHRDLDEECFHDSSSKAFRQRQRLKERRQSKINSAAVARCSLKTLSNLPSSGANPATLAALSKTKLISEKAKSSSQKSTSKAEAATKDDDIELTSTTTANRKISSTEAATTSLVESSNPNMQTTKQSTPPTTKLPVEYNRQQSVSFSDEAANQSIAQQQPGNNESSLHLHHHYHNHPHHHHHHHHQSPPQSSYPYGQRNVLVDQQVKEETSSDLDLLLQQQQQQKNIQSAPVQSTNQLAVYTKQDSIRSAPPGADLLSVSGANNNYLQRPLEMSCLNSSFASSINTGIGLDSSYNNSPLLMNKSSLTIDPVLNTDNQHLPIRVLHKSMTKGSKAMRIMGNNSLSIGNGPLKSTASAASIGQKSTNSFGRSANMKKIAQRRLFFKNGNINISRSNIDKRRRRYLTDIFTTLIDLKWRYNILVFLLGFFISWTFFACAWYIISYLHGDLETHHTANYTSCISGIHGFAGAILFSIETQQTIGYGVRYTTEKCPEAIFVMMIQSSVGVMIQSFMVGVVFAKLSRPKKRSETLMFSKNAVISLRDGRLCLICRVGDMRKSHIVEAHVRMYLIKKKVTLEGEILPLHMYDLNVGWDKGLDRLFLVWPLTIEHNIDENSPLWTVSAEDLRKERFELAVILEGIVESTGMTTQARSSYLVNEILWGHRFEKLITFQKEDGTYKIDYSRFDVTVPIDTPTCSAKEWAELREQEKFYSQHFSSMSNPSIFTAGSTSYLGNAAHTASFNAGNGGSGDLRKRSSFNRQDTNGGQSDENANGATIGSTQQPRMLENYGNAIKMVIEDHSNITTGAMSNVDDDVNAPLLFNTNSDDSTTPTTTNPPIITTITTNENTNNNNTATNIDDLIVSPGTQHSTNLDSTDLLFNEQIVNV